MTLTSQLLTWLEILHLSLYVNHVLPNLAVLEKVSELHIASVRSSEVVLCKSDSQCCLVHLKVLEGHLYFRPLIQATHGNIDGNPGLNPNKSPVLDKKRNDDRNRDSDRSFNDDKNEVINGRAHVVVLNSSSPSEFWHSA
jgi:hypothetical protein